MRWFPGSASWSLFRRFWGWSGRRTRQWSRCWSGGWTAGEPRSYQSLHHREWKRLTGQRWKSQRIKIYRLGYVILEITNIWQKSQDFWFAAFFIRFIKSLGWYGFFLWIFGYFECLSSMFCLNLLLILNYKCYFIKTHFQKHFCVKGYPPPPPKKNL